MNTACGQEVLNKTIKDRSGKKVVALLNRCAECGDNKCRLIAMSGVDEETEKKEKSP